MDPTDETLARIPLFRSLDEAAIRHLDAACTWRRASAGAWVLDYRSGGTELFFVLHGHVRVVIAGASREMILRDIHDGEFFGELAAIDGRPRSAGVLAVTETLVARMPAAVFRRAVHEHPDVCDQLLLTLVTQIRALSNRANEHSTLGARQRLYAELLRLARVPAGADGGRLVVSPPPTHAELAARVSSHREAITRELNALERGGLIERRRGAIVLLDAPRLRRMAAQPGEA
jgi:CRP/FNR family transcriptional regulator, cyclic AMP receptor protein